MYPVFQHLIIGHSLKILAPNCSITRFSALIILTRTRDGIFPYISIFYWLFTLISLGLQCQRLFLGLQKLWFNHSKHHSCSHKAVKENKSSANLGLVSRPGKIAPKNKPSNLKTFGHGSSIITYKVSSITSYPWYVIAALLHSARSPQMSSHLFLQKRNSCSLCSDSTKWFLPNCMTFLLSPWWKWSMSPVSQYIFNSNFVPLCSHLLVSKKFCTRDTLSKV